MTDKYLEYIGFGSIYNIVTNKTKSHIYSSIKFNSRQDFRITNYHVFFQLSRLSQYHCQAIRQIEEYDAL